MEHSEVRSEDPDEALSIPIYLTSSQPEVSREGTSPFSSASTAEPPAADEDDNGAGDVDAPPGGEDSESASAKDKDRDLDYLCRLEARALQLEKEKSEETAKAKEALGKFDMLKRAMKRIQGIGKSMTEATSCPVCLELTGSMVGLYCTHVVCEKCLKTWVERGARVRQHPVCPVCNQPFAGPRSGVKARALNESIVGLKAIEGELKSLKSLLADKSEEAAMTPGVLPAVVVGPISLVEPPTRKPKRSAAQAGLLARENLVELDRDEVIDLR